MARPRTTPMLADGGPVGEFKPSTTQVDDRRQAIEQSRVAKQQQPDLQTRLNAAVNKVQQAVNQLNQAETPAADNPYANETGWRNMSFGWTADNRLIQQIVGNSGKILGYVYADNGQPADPSAVIPGKVVTQPAPVAEQATSTMSTEDVALQREQRAAKATLQSWLTTFFDASKDKDIINSLMSFVDEQIMQDVPTSAIMLNIRNQKFYQDRFSGNKALREKGLPELTPAEYLSFESGYSEALRMAGLDRLATRANFSSLIGGEVSVPELQDRITNVYSRIVNADTALKNELQALKASANITDADLAESLLMGKEGAANLKRRIAMAEVGAEFTPRGLTSALGTSELVSLGVTREQARTGAEYTRAGMERLGTLANIYGEATTGLQAELESEAFRGLESRRRRMLTEREKATFAGSAGTGTPSLGTSAAGAI